jgi:uncharacterized metal-binding protein
MSPKTDMDEKLPRCADCPVELADRACRREGGRGPADCPTLRHKDLAAEALLRLEEPGLREFARQASLQEAEGYEGRDQGYARLRPVKPRIVETVEFAKRMGYQRLGLVFCIGLRKEAGVVAEIFETNGLEVVSVCCKVGRAPKSALGLGREAQIDKTAPAETMCNPVLQALAVNRAKVDLNVLLGLCVGHDSLFLRHAEAMSTVLAVKDRLLGHNPLAAVHAYDGYCRYLKAPL